MKDDTLGKSTPEEAILAGGEAVDAARAAVASVRIRGLTPAEQDRLLNELVRLDRRATVAESWHAGGFLPEDNVTEAAAFIVEYHHVAAFDRARLAEWQARLTRSVEQAFKLLPPRRPPAGPELGAVEPDDEAAPMAPARTEDA